MPRAALALVLAAAARALGGPPEDAAERQREEIARELIRLGEELRRQILAGDVAALVARVPPEGLRCAGRLVPRARVARDLATPGSWLHDTLLGARRGDGPPGAPPASVAELLRTSEEVAITVAFVRDPRAPLGRPCLEFRARGLVTPGAPLCFERRGDRWWFTESLYPCG